MNTGVNYKLFYEILLNLREAFHSYGRIDDSNSKLDEIIKLIMLSYYHATKGEKFSLSFVKDYAIKKYCEKMGIAEDEIAFVGDDYGPGGNDESVYKSPIRFITIDDYRTFPEVIRGAGLL